MSERIRCPALAYPQKSTLPQIPMGAVCGETGRDIALDKKGRPKTHKKCPVRKLPGGVGNHCNIDPNLIKEEDVRLIELNGKEVIRIRVVLRL